MIVVNDGSTDESLDELHELASRDSRVRIFDQPNQGQNAAANFGIEQSRAPLIARMDADDISSLDRIEKQVAFLNAHSEVGLLGGQITRLGEKRSGLTSNFPVGHDQIVEYLLKNQHALCNPAIIFRKHLFEKIGGYWEHDIAEDWDMFLRMGEISRLANLSQSILQYRFHQASINGRRIVEAQLFNEYAADRYLRRRGDLPALTFNEFLASHRSQRWPMSWAFKADALSIGQYRQAIAEIYGGKSIRGAVRLSLSMAMSPARTIRRFWNMAGRLTGSQGAEGRQVSSAKSMRLIGSSLSDEPQAAAAKSVVAGSVNPAAFRITTTNVDSANTDAP